jgi:hypothetical protein
MNVFYIPCNNCPVIVFVFIYLFSVGYDDYQQDVCCYFICGKYREESDRDGVHGGGDWQGLDRRAEDRIWYCYFRCVLVFNRR